MLLQHGDNIEETDSKGDTPLHMAVRGGYTDVVTELLAAGAVLDVRNVAGETAYVVAKNLGSKEMQAMLIRGGARQEFILHWAAQHGDQQARGCAWSFIDDGKNLFFSGRALVNLNLRLNLNSGCPRYVAWAGPGQLAGKCGQITKR